MPEIDVSLQKTTTTSRTYENHSVDASFAHTLGGSPIAVRVVTGVTAAGVGRLDLPAASEIDGDVVVRVMSPDGRVLRSSTHSSAAPIPNPLNFTVDPAIVTTTFDLIVHVPQPPPDPNPDPNRPVAPDFSGHRIRVNFTRVVESDTGTTRVNDRVSADLSPGGDAALSLPNLQSLRGPVTFRTLGPDGSVLSIVTVDPELELAALPTPSSGVPLLTLPAVTPLVIYAVAPNTDPGFGKPAKIRGRVLDLAGEIPFGGRQLLVFGRPVRRLPNEELEVSDEFVPVFVTTVLVGGYFTAEYPIGYFDEAYAVLGESSRLNVPIRLDPALEGQTGTFPANVLIVLEGTTEDIVPAAEASCLCRSAVPRFPDVEDMANAPELFAADLGTGGCINFHNPNRTLQQFDFCRVVRTSEPEVRGLVIADLQTVPLQFLVDLLTPELTTTQLTQLNQYIAGTAPYLPHPADSTLLDVELAEVLASDPEGFTIEKLGRALFESDRRIVAARDDQNRASMAQRTELHGDVAIDWDDTPTVFQAATVAHGHLLHFKQEWVADGYSLGDLLYSLPLAPGQKKNIAIVDWERRETAARVESRDEREALFATLTRDRDISEIVTGALREDSRGGSSSQTSSSAGGGGIGLILGPIGIGGGAAGGSSSSSSSAWQTSSRDTVASSLQKLHDQTAQAAQAVRSQRATVIQSVTENESVKATTEVVANHNHCHALTMEYFEVLRHFLVRQRLSDVQECLLVPFLMSAFDGRKALRWRSQIAPFLLDRSVGGGFVAIERIRNSYVGSDVPRRRFADEPIEYIEGFLRLRFKLARPADAADGTYIASAWAGLLSILTGFSSFGNFHSNFIRPQLDKDGAFLRELGPRIATAFVDAMKITLELEAEGGGPTPAPVTLDIDATLASTFANDVPLYVSIALGSPIASPVPVRSQVKAVKISVTFSDGGTDKGLAELLSNSTVIVESGQITYRLLHSQGELFKSSRIQNDLSTKDGVRIGSPLTREERRHPRQEDQEIRLRLLKHLNDNLEYYHRVVWSQMDPARRYMLLDGITAPNSGGRSVASVVESRLIGICGNTMIFPVIPGLHLDPTLQRRSANDEPLHFRLLDLYQPDSPPPIARFAVPTKGVFVEAIQGACNACEPKDESRLWRWEESPTGDEPPALQTTTTDTRSTKAPDLTPTPFPNAIINLQNAPAEPNPVGVAAALQLLAKPNLFQDITGLTQNQRNAIEGLSAAFKAAQDFSQQASNLALQGRMSRDLDKTLNTIKQAYDDGIIDEATMHRLGDEAFSAASGGGAQTPAKSPSSKQVGELAKTAAANRVAASLRQSDGTTVEVDGRGSESDATSGNLISTASPDNSQDARAFFPSQQDVSGITRLTVTVAGAPEGAATRWTARDPSKLAFDTPDRAQTDVLALNPGRTTATLTVTDKDGTVIDTASLEMSVPQFVTVEQNQVEFDSALSTLGLLTLKERVLREAKAVCEHLLTPANVRMIWRVAPFSSGLPRHLPAGSVTQVTLRGNPPSSSLVGVTKRPQGLAGERVPNETIEIYPGGYDDPIPAGQDVTDVDETTQTIVIYLKARTADADFASLAVLAFGRLLGETIAHEVGHALGRPHNAPALPGDLMNSGANRPFLQRTGLEIEPVEPIDPSKVKDHGVKAIGGFKPSQHAAHFRANFPVPPDL